MRKLNFDMLFLLLFLFIGFLEGGMVGSVAGFFFWAVPSLLLGMALIPFVGYFIYNGSLSLFTGNIDKFLSLPTLHEKLWLVYNSVALVLNVIISVLVVILIVVAVSYRRRKKIAMQTEEFSVYERIREYASRLKPPSIEKLKELLKDLDRRIVGSAIFFFGVGVASHDFWWETTEDVNVARVTHGAYVGLGVATTGIMMIREGVWRNLPHFCGVLSCIVGFALLRFLPKGVSRIVSHVFWWLGVSLMMWNWYMTVEPYSSSDMKEIEKLKSVVDATFEAS